MSASSYCTVYRKLLIAVICFCLPGFCMAQGATQDTLKLQTTGTYKDHHVAATEYKPGVAAFIIPASFIGYGLVSLAGDNVVRRLDYSTKNELQEDHPLFAAHIDDYLQFVPAAAVYGLNLAGVKGQHSLLDATGLYILSSAIAGGSVTIVKRASHRERPNGAGFDSFPSGHTANAFAAAEFLNQEYKDVSPWYGIAGYAVATATGTLRMYNNKHWLSDVVAGAGFGILSTKVAYFIYPKLKRLVSGNRAMNYNVVPSYQQHSFGLSFNGTF
ncbi:MAG: phosphatase PAP2 family protein [Candidatus Pedobacter colombiensis]|uniref:Phosphatase PAP2 family protein n=1 Tax=Candidatus Pedobacter colombiensis TaxID=3121371 RepID=A0AAJ5W442_9SPHI|nr:phosphatase PAP2 family protein [Pedobacter sp.]WEK17602.1 MAG: phosphatase PAP2 family protein [Pedobacter sp.]